MKIPTPFLSAVETAINTWLKLDEYALPKFAKLNGKVIRLHISGLDLNLYFFPSGSGVQVLGNYPSEKNGGIVDATIHGSPMALIRLGTSNNTGENILKSDLEIDGDIHAAASFSTILKEVDIDWEELLSKLVGDIIAHQAGQVTRHSTGWLAETAEVMKLNISEYISEESKLSPANSEIQNQMKQVDDIRMGVDRIEARINILLREKNDKEIKYLQDELK